MMMAVVGFMPKVKGTSMAVPATGPTPGRTPMIVPMVYAEKTKEEIGGGDDRDKTRNQVFRTCFSPYIPRKPVGSGDFSHNRKMA